MFDSAATDKTFGKLSRWIFKPPADDSPLLGVTANYFSTSNDAGVPDALSWQIQTWNLPGWTTQLPWAS